MVEPKKEMQLAKPQGRQLSQYSTETQHLINSNGWQFLVTAGKFDEMKALLAVKTTSIEYINSLTHRSIQDVFSKPTATLATVKKYKGENYMNAVLKVLIQNLCAMLNLGMSMNDLQIELAANLLFSEYYYLTIADFKVCFRNGVLGKYGKLFDRLDIMVLTEWIETYIGERSGIAIAANESNKKENSGVRMPGWFQNKIQETAAEKTKWSLESQLSESKIVRYSTLNDYFKANDVSQETKNKILQKWESEFDSMADADIEKKAFLKWKAILLLNDINQGASLNTY